MRDGVCASPLAQNPRTMWSRKLNLQLTSSGQDLHHATPESSDMESASAYQGAISQLAATRAQLHERHHVDISLLRLVCAAAGYGLLPL